MPIEFRCSKCGRLLRTPDDTAGKQAQCPECGSLTTVPGGVAGGQGEPLRPEAAGSPFGGPAPGSVPRGGDAENPYQSPAEVGPPPFVPYTGLGPPPASRVFGPAIALMVLAAVGMASCLMGLAVSVLQIGIGAMNRRHDAMPMMMFGSAAVASDVICLLMGTVVILGALKMKNLERYALAVAAAVITMVPCISPAASVGAPLGLCCCIPGWAVGLGFGIWAIVVLCDAQVKSAFRS